MWKRMVRTWIVRRPAMHGDEADAQAAEAALAQMVLADARRLEREAVVPPAGRVFWKAELRLRREATATATKPISLVEAVAAACGIGLIASLAGALAALWSPQWRGMVAVVSRPFTAFADATVVQVAALALALAWILIAPVVVYVATAKSENL